MIKIVNITAKKLGKIVLMKEKMRKERMQRIRQKSLLQCKNLGLCTQWDVFKTNLILLGFVFLAFQCVECLLLCLHTSFPSPLVLKNERMNVCPPFIISIILSSITSSHLKKLNAHTPTSYTTITASSCLSKPMCMDRS